MFLLLQILMTLKSDKYSFRFFLLGLGVGGVNLFLYAINVLIFEGKGVENAPLHCRSPNDTFD